MGENMSKSYIQLKTKETDRDDKKPPAPKPPAPKPPIKSTPGELSESAERDWNQQRPPKPDSPPIPKEQPKPKT
jgi:hypothetical protein